jgi:hypothetical protein
MMNFFKLLLWNSICGATTGRLEMKRKSENQRLYDLKISWQQGKMVGGQVAPNAELGVRHVTYCSPRHRLVFSTLAS